MVSSCNTSYRLCLVSLPNTHRREEQSHRFFTDKRINRLTRAGVHLVERRRLNAVMEELGSSQAGLPLINNRKNRWGKS